VTTEANIAANGPPKPPVRSPWQVSKAVWYALILREFQSLLWSRRFGAFWVLAEPIANIAIMMVLFAYVRGQLMPGIPFALFLLTGIVPFFMMREIIFGLMGAVSANQALFTYRQVKPFDTFIARATVQVIIYLSVYVILASFMVFFLQYSVPVHLPLEMMATLSLMVVFAFGLGVIFCLIVQAFPDLSSIIRLMFLPLYLLSSVIFPLRFIPQPYYDWLLLNPFMHLVDLFRQYSLSNYQPLPGVNMTYPAQWALVGLFVAVLAYRRRQYDLVTS